MEYSVAYGQPSCICCGRAQLGSLQMETFNPFPLTRLPRELRDRIYELLFFSERNDDVLPGIRSSKVIFNSRKLKWASVGLAGTAKNQIHPYRRNSKHQPKYDVAILRTCHQIHEEAEAVFYGRSSFNLITDNFGPGEYQSYEFLENLPRRCRKLIRKIEYRCYHQHLPETPAKRHRRSMTMFDWNAFMKFLALECPSLQSLILWGFADKQEGEQMRQSCQQDSEWIQAIFQIRTLRFFDLPAIPRGKIKPGQSCVPEFLKQLRVVLYHQKSKVHPESEKNNMPSAVSSPFSFMNLPRHIRDRIYRFALLPAHKQIHPGIKPWYDGTTRNTLPLCLTCHQVHQEAELILYSHGTFCCVQKNSNLTLFFRDLPQRLRVMIRTIRVLNCNDITVLMNACRYLSTYLNLNMLSFGLTDDLVSWLNRWWVHNRETILREDIFHFNKGFIVETPGCSLRLDSDLRDYFACRFESRPRPSMVEDPIHRV